MLLQKQKRHEFHELKELYFLRISEISGIRGYFSVSRYDVCTKWYRSLLQKTPSFAYCSSIRPSATIPIPAKASRRAYSVYGMHRQPKKNLFPIKLKPETLTEVAVNPVGQC